jgi:YD repeat-containing protein
VKSASYDQAGDLSTLLDANNTQQTYSYDAMGHLTAVSDTASGSYGTHRYSYDPNGNRTCLHQIKWLYAVSCGTQRHRANRRHHSLRFFTRKNMFIKPIKQVK